MKTTTLTIDVVYDDSKTDPEAIASAADALLEMALSSPGLMDEYGDPDFRPFFVQGSILPTLNVIELQKLAIKKALQKHGGRVSKACCELGMGRATLYRWLNEKKV